MGALSSWAMLALTHHFIVQLAAFRAGKKIWFGGYMVLGDDIVIFDKDVAHEYLIIMKDLGVDINLSKSLVSKDTFEFAKRVISLKGNLSMVSFRELDVAMSSLDALALLISKFSRETIKPSLILRLRGYGYRVLSEFTRELRSLPRHLQMLVLWMQYPGMTPFSMANYIDWFGLSSFGRTKAKGPAFLQSLGDIFRKLWEDSQPEGSTTELVARDIWGPTGIVGDHWTAEYLEAALQNLLWPVQMDYMDSHRAHDSMRRGISVPTGADITAQSLEDFFLAYLQWDAEASLTPNHRDISVYKDVDTPVRAKMGRYLSLWVRSASARGKL